MLASYGVVRMLSHRLLTRENKRAHHSEASRFHKITESTDPRSPTPEVVLPPPPEKGWGEGEKKCWGLGWGPWIPWIPWPFAPGATCDAMASDLRDGRAFFLTGTSFPGNAG